MASPGPAATKAVALGSRGGCACSAQTASDTRPDAHGVKGDAVAGGGHTLARATVGQSGRALAGRPCVGGADSCWGGGEPVPLRGRCLLSSARLSAKLWQRQFPQDEIV